MDIETIMIIAFAVALIISIWKIYVFLPKKQLEDDDTTKEATEKLTDITIRSIIEGHEKNGSMTHKELFEHISSHKDFDKEHFWRFNQNRLNQLCEATTSAIRTQAHSKIFIITRKIKMEKFKRMLY